jgi:hypothetical protein
LDLVLNFNFLIVASLILASSCGVKGPPTAPKGTEVPSFVSPYLQDKDVKKEISNDEDSSKKEKKE